MSLLNNCRLCLSEPQGHDEYVPLYLEDEGSISRSLDQKVASMIMYTVSIQIEDVNCQPAHICVSCYKELKKFNAFKKKCQSSDNELKELSKEQQFQREIDTTDETSVEICLRKGDEFEDYLESEIQKHSDLTEHNVLGEENSLLKEALEATAPEMNIKIINVTTLENEDNLETLDHDLPLSEAIAKLKENMKRKKNGYKCSFCKAKFRREVSMKTHEEKHKLSYRCVHCYESFLTHAKLQKHKLEVHNEDPYYCTFCMRGFQDVQPWTEHMKLQHITCPKCKLYFRTEKDREEHRCQFNSNTQTSQDKTEPSTQKHGRGKPRAKFISSYSQCRKYLLNVHKGKKRERTQEKIECITLTEPRTQKRGRPRTKFISSYSQCRKYLFNSHKEKKREGTQENIECMALMEDCVTDTHRTSDIAKESGKKAAFTCTICGQCFLDKGSLICHEALHPSQRLQRSGLFCQLCLNFFHNANDVYNHGCFNNQDRCIVSVKNREPACFGGKKYVTSICYKNI